MEKEGEKKREKINDNAANSWSMAVHQGEGGGSWGGRKVIIMGSVLIRTIVGLEKYSPTSGAHFSLD